MQVNDCKTIGSNEKEKMRQFSIVQWFHSRHTFLHRFEQLGCGCHLNIMENRIRTTRKLFRFLHSVRNFFIGLCQSRSECRYTCLFPIHLIYSICTRASIIPSTVAVGAECISGFHHWIAMRVHAVFERTCEMSETKYVIFVEKQRRRWTHSLTLWTHLMCSIGSTVPMPIVNYPKESNRIESNERRNKNQVSAFLSERLWSERIKRKLMQLATRTDRWWLIEASIHSRTASAAPLSYCLMAHVSTACCLDRMKFLSPA